MGIVVAQYRAPLSFELDMGRIEVNTHPDVCEALEQQIRDNAYKLMTPQALKAAQAAGRAVDVSADDFEG